MPACFRKASISVVSGALRETTGSWNGAAPALGRGKGSVPASALASSFSGPNSSNISSFWVKGWAPNIGLGKPLVG